MIPPAQDHVYRNIYHTYNTQVKKKTKHAQLKILPRKAVSVIPKSLLS